MYCLILFVGKSYHSIWCTVTPVDKAHVLTCLSFPAGVQSVWC